MATAFQGFRSLVEHSPVAISLVDTQGEILYGSASTTKLFGYEPEELVGKNCLELIHPEDRDHSSRALREVLAKSPDTVQWDARFRRKDGSYCWVESTVSNLLASAEVRAIVVHQRDIDDRRAAEVDRQRDAEELARCNARLEEFAYTAAHDLREPLRAIKLCTEMLVKRMVLDEDTRNMADLMVAGAARMSILINDLLAFAVSGVHEPPQSVDLQRAVSVATQNLALAIQESGAKITVGRLPAVSGNEIQFVRLLQNLIGNALKYRAERPVEIHVLAERRGSEWLIKVQDNGVGIAAEDQSRIFLPFVRLANRDIPGSGLGLAVCKKIVEGMGGEIGLESEPGFGSTFSFSIAAANQAPG